MREHDLVLSPGGVPEGHSGPMVRVLRVRGRLDATTDEELLDGVRSAAASLRSGSSVLADREPGASRAVLLLDLDEVSWCDSRGLGALVRAVTVAVRQGVSLRLAAEPGSPAARMIARVAMADVLALRSSVDDVLAGPHPCPLETELDPS